MADLSARDLVLSQQSLTRAVSQLTRVMTGNMQQMWRLSDLAKRWGRSKSEVRRVLQMHGALPKTERGQVIHVPLETVLAVENRLKDEVHYDH